MSLEQAYTEIAAHLVKLSCLSDAEVENLRDSGPRVARGVLEMIWSKGKILQELREALYTRFPVEPGFAEDMPIIVGPILTHSLCPHHLLPISNRVTIGYIREGSAIGLSKLPRIADALARRAVVQEQYTQDMVEVLTRGSIGTHAIQAPLSASVAVNVSAVHQCMSCRGVLSAASTTTSVVTGDMAKDVPFKLFTQHLELQK